MRTRQKCVATDTWRSLGCRTTPLEHWSRRKPTVEPRWAKQQTKKLRPKSPFLKSGHIFARDHSLGISSVSIDCWNRWTNTGPNSEASSFRTLGWSSSGPKALDGFRPLRSLVTPTAETTISFMKGADRFGSGTWLCSFLLNTSVNWPLNSSVCSNSDSQHRFHFSS